MSPTISAGAVSTLPAPVAGALPPPFSTMTGSSSITAILVVPSGLQAPSSMLAQRSTAAAKCSAEASVRCAAATSRMVDRHVERAAWEGEEPRARPEEAPREKHLSTTAAATKAQPGHLWYCTTASSRDHCRSSGGSASAPDSMSGQASCNMCCSTPSPWRRAATGMKEIDSAIEVPSPLVSHHPWPSSAACPAQKRKHCCRTSDDALPSQALATATREGVTSGQVAAATHNSQRRAQVASRRPCGDKASAPATSRASAVANALCWSSESSIGPTSLTFSQPPRQPHSNETSGTSSALLAIVSTLTHRPRLS
mmetsp:Transcript_46530/g.117015  ORF Transcript_46530/g.117015 Transcript_46530/m.117015 type:complete len:312 (+) Transcript_46530:1170-2105(+)